MQFKAATPCTSGAAGHHSRGISGSYHTNCFFPGCDRILGSPAYVVSEDDAAECRAEARDERTEHGEECGEVYAARLDLCELLGEERFDVEFDPGDFLNPPDGNTYWPLTPGHTHVVVGEGEVTVVTVTPVVRSIGGLPCRVVRDLVFEEEDDGGYEYSALEVTQDWYGELDFGVDPDIGNPGDTIYCGENTYEIEDELIDNTDGSLANDNELVRAGFLVRAMPEDNPGLGGGDRQEMASDEAEDYVQYVSVTATPSGDEGGDSANYPCAGTCLQTFEVNPHDPGEGEFKYYRPIDGFVLATKLELDDGEYVPTGEREEVTCIGTDLDIIDDASCNIGDPAALREAFCAWAEPDAEWVPADFCD